MPVIVGALGLIRKGMVLSLGKVPGANNIDELQKIILLETAHILKTKVSVHQTKNSTAISGPRNGPGSGRV